MALCDRRFDGSSTEREARAILLRERPPFDRLVALIKEINPTGRVRDRADAEARYALKSKLQSALIRHYDADLTVEADAVSPGVVLLRHALLALDACHATLASLDEDARTLAEQRLAATPDPPRTAPARARHEPTPTPRAAASAVRTHLGEAAAALDDYDYERAKELLTLAFQQSGGALAPAVALLSLLVDLLAADDEALGLASRLGHDAERSPEVMALLALAAARGGDEERARRLARAGSARRGRAGGALARRRPPRRPRGRPA